MTSFFSFIKKVPSLCHIKNGWKLSYSNGIMIEFEENYNENYNDNILITFKDRKTLIRFNADANLLSKAITNSFYFY